MSRNKQNKKAQSSALPAATSGESAATPTKVVSALPSTSSAMRRIVTPTVADVRVEMPGVIVSPWGDGYLTNRARPLADDQIHWYFGQWTFDIKAYHDLGAVTAVEPRDYDASQAFLDAAYGYMRQLMKLSRKPRLKQDVLNTSGIMRDYFNVYHFAVANLVALASVFKMLIYNEGFTTLGSYLPDRMVRLNRLWARLSSLVVPEFLKTLSLRDGAVVMGTRIRVPHVRVWSSANLGIYGGAADYSTGYMFGTTMLSNAGLHLYAAMRTAGDLDANINEIEKAVYALEGIPNAALGTTVRDDILSMKEVFEYMATVEEFAPKYGQGLPDLMGLPPYLEDDALLSEWYTRGLYFYDTHGGLADFAICFPTMNISGLDQRIPICGWGPRSTSDFCLLGAVKYFACVNDVVDGTFVDDATAGVVARAMGMSLPSIASNGHPGYEQIWTREDEDEQMTRDVTDFGDGLNIRTWVNSGHPANAHIWLPAIAYAGQLGAGLEYRFIDMAIGRTDHHMWVEPNDYPERTMLWLAAAMGLPPLK